MCVNSLYLPRWEAAPAAEALTANLEAVRNAYIVDRGRGQWIKRLNLSEKHT
jgi:hypothetical protein